MFKPCYACDGFGIMWLDGEIKCSCLMCSPDKKLEELEKKKALYLADILLDMFGGVSEVIQEKRT